MSNHDLLLITCDPALVRRLRQSLATIPSLSLTVAPAYLPCPRSSGWLLLLVDESVGEEAWGNRQNAAVPVDNTIQFDSTPVIWLGRLPYLGSAALQDGGAVDFLPRNVSVSKLSFVLQQHTAAACLRRRRLRVVRARMSNPTQPSQLAPSLPPDFNDALTGVLGNAELALDAYPRLNGPLRNRLVRILESARLMRDLLLSAL